MDAGVDSLGASELVQQLTKEFGVELSATLLFDHPSVSSVSLHLAQELTSIDLLSRSTIVPSTVATQLCSKREANEGPPILVTPAVDGVAVVSYNCPHKNNAFDAAISGALVAILAKVNKESATRAIIITGRGAYFCTAAKFDEMLRPARPTELHEPITTGSQAIFDSFITLSKPILAAVNGPAFGGGVTQATLCEGVMSLRHAKYSLPFSRWNVSPEGCSSVHLARVAGRS